MIEYVLGFIFSRVSDQVVLLEKINPEWQRGKLNGIGGKIEKEETPLEAMIRETKEETGLDIEDWECFGSIEGKQFKSYCFRVFTNRAYMIESMEAEKVDRYKVSDLNNLNVISNLKYLIPMALDFNLKTGNIYYDT